MTDGNSPLPQRSYALSYFKVAFLTTALSCPVQVALLVLWWQTGFWWAMVLPFIVFVFSFYFFLCNNFGKPYFGRRFIAMCCGFLCGYVATYGWLFKLAIDAMD